MPRYDFGNILLSGACNLRCPHCIGRSLPAGRQPDVLGRFPLPGLEAFIEELRRAGTTQITVTGTNTDPQLYAHERRLLAHLRAKLPTAQISLHTNGLLCLRKPMSFNSYDRATISLPSFRAQTCERMTGRARALDLARITALARIPLKISTLVTEHNVGEIPAIMARCRRLGLRRMALRTLHGEARDWGLLRDRRPARWFRGLPVYDVDGLEVTLWRFERTSLRCLNLFADGTVSDRYQLGGSPS